MKVLEGRFLENQWARVSIEGNHYTRKVRYNKMDGLYIVVDNRKYFEYEAEY